MPHKDPEKQREYNRDNKERRNKISLEWYRKKHPNAKHYDSYCDFETHRELAIHSGIQSKQEWRECFKLGLMPDGIYADPERVFRRK